MLQQDTLLPQLIRYQWQVFKRNFQDPPLLAAALLVLISTAMNVLLGDVKGATLLYMWNSQILFCPAKLRFVDWKRVCSRVSFFCHFFIFLFFTIFLARGPLNIVNICHHLSWFTMSENTIWFAFKMTSVPFYVFCCCLSSVTVLTMKTSTQKKKKQNNN